MLATADRQHRRPIAKSHNRYAPLQQSPTLAMVGRQHWRRSIANIGDGRSPMLAAAATPRPQSMRTGLTVASDGESREFHGESQNSNKIDRINKIDIIVRNEYDIRDQHLELPLYAGPLSGVVQTAYFPSGAAYQAGGGCQRQSHTAFCMK
ncbi:hypothetical protein Y032_1057g3511 [Ancylostoma ceylanicum]|uniref:Uncharacterized protein n=1 Tax=Ancylostoma ceylanicum TaxID=53326 RepID=A0A016W701_9BILA|nr:hypothetical protein Y032_1057g3511 [Ancylostoma ceylanicum]